MIEKKQTDIFTKIIVFLIPPSLVFSIVIMELISLIIILLFIFQSTKKVKKDLFLNKFFLIFLSFYIICVFSSLISDYVIFSLKNSLFYIRFILFAICLYWLFTEFKNLKQIFFYSLLLTLFLVSLSGYYEFFIKQNCWGYDPEYKVINTDHFYCKKFLFIGNDLRADRLSGFFGDEMILGSFLVRLLPVLICLNLFFKKFSNFKFNLFLIFISVAIIISGERLPILFLIIIISSYLFICLKIKNFIITSFILTIIVSSLIYNFPSLKKRIIDDTITQIFHPYHETKQDKKKLTFFSMEHQSHAMTAINIFKNNIFFGAGPKSFRFACSKKENYVDKNSCTTHPHNTFLQIFSEVGIFGSIPIIIFFIIILKNIFIFYRVKSKNKNTKKDNLIFIIMISFIISLFPIVPSGNFFNNWLNYIYYLPLPFYLYVKRNLKY